MTKFTNYVKTRPGTSYTPDEQGVWQIFGEDPNCDFGGHHHQPLLDTVSGTYKEVVEYALTLENFYTWGGGGEVRKLRISTMQEVSDRKQIAEKIKNLEAEISHLRAKL